MLLLGSQEAHREQQSHRHNTPCLHLRPQQLGLNAELLKGPITGSFTYKWFWRKSHTEAAGHSSWIPSPSSFPAVLSTAASSLQTPRGHPHSISRLSTKTQMRGEDLSTLEAQECLVANGCRIMVKPECGLWIWAWTRITSLTPPFTTYCLSVNLASSNLFSCLHTG